MESTDKQSELLSGIFERFGFGPEFLTQWPRSDQDRFLALYFEHTLGKADRVLSIADHMNRREYAEARRSLGIKDDWITTPVLHLRTTLKSLLSGLIRITDSEFQRDLSERYEAWRHYMEEQDPSASHRLSPEEAWSPETENFPPVFRDIHHFRVYRDYYFSRNDDIEFRTFTERFHGYLVNLSRRMAADLLPDLITLQPLIRQDRLQDLLGEKIPEFEATLERLKTEVANWAPA